MKERLLFCGILREKMRRTRNLLDQVALPEPLGFMYGECCIDQGVPEVPVLADRTDLYVENEWQFVSKTLRAI